MNSSKCLRTMYVDLCGVWSRQGFRELVDDDIADDVNDFNYDYYYQPVLSSRCGRGKVVASLSASGNPLLNCRSSQCWSSSTLDQ